jgi:SPP1 family predicted phage head-tail adaptor
MSGAGTLRRRPTIEARVRIPDGYGGWTEGWEARTALWARYRPLSASERMDAMARGLVITGRIRTRYRQDLPRVARFIMGDRVYETAGLPVDENDRRRYLLWDVTEARVDFEEAEGGS